MNAEPSANGPLPVAVAKVAMVAIRKTTNAAAPVPKLIAAHITNGITANIIRRDSRMPNGATTKMARQISVTSVSNAPYSMVRRHDSKRNADASVNTSGATSNAPVASPSQ
jgi:hypothetical protein